MTTAKLASLFLMGCMSFSSAIAIDTSSTKVSLDGATSNPPTNYGVVLFPGFQALGKQLESIPSPPSNKTNLKSDVFGPLDILNTLGWDHKISLSVLAATKEPVSTYVGANNSISSGFHERITPTHTFDTAPQDIEVLLVPGGKTSPTPFLCWKMNEKLTRHRQA
jgi:hypothetical protein